MAASLHQEIPAATGGMGAASIGVIVRQKLERDGEAEPRVLGLVHHFPPLPSFSTMRYWEMVFPIMTRTAIERWTVWGILPHRAGRQA